MNPNACICPLSETDAGRRVPSLVPDGSSEGRMQYAPTAYRKKRPFLPIYLGASRKEKEKGRPSAIPACRGVLHTPYQMAPTGDRRRPASTFFSSLDRRKEGKRRSRPLPRPGKMGRMCLIGSVREPFRRRNFSPHPFFCLLF